MTPTDDALLDFDGGDPAKARRDLEEHGDTFRVQLVIARQLDQWAEQAEVTKTSKTTDLSWVDGRVRTLREVAEHLRRGDFLPGGSLAGETAGD